MTIIALLVDQNLSQIYAAEDSIFRRLCIMLQVLHKYVGMLA
jgi:hypothetical protein